MITRRLFLGSDRLVLGFIVVIVVLGIRIFGNAAALRRRLFGA